MTVEWMRGARGSERLRIFFQRYLREDRDDRSAEGQSQVIADDTLIQPVRDQPAEVFPVQLPHRGFDLRIDDGFGGSDLRGSSIGCELPLSSDTGHCAMKDLQHP